MSKSILYVDGPESIRYMGHRYVVAADEAAEKETTEDAEARKRGRPGAPRIREDRCRYNGIKFVIDALAFDSANKIPFKGKAHNSGNFELSIKQIKRLDQIPPTILDHISEDTEEGQAVRERIQKLLEPAARKDSTTLDKGLYLIQAEGGWNWADKNTGTKGVQEMHDILSYVSSDRPALLYVYCANSLL